MIKVSVMYPNKTGVRFDHSYYRDKHLPLIESRMGATLSYYTIDKGLYGGPPGAPAAYVGMCHLMCDSVAAYEAGFGPHAEELTRDIRNFTDTTPIVQISEVVVERSVKAPEQAAGPGRGARNTAAAG
jgi:uncharacterized protein (TIGR02118 family)